jgi:hypothetical protein
LREEDLIDNRYYYAWTVLNIVILCSQWTINNYKVEIFFCFLERTLCFVANKPDFNKLFREMDLMLVPYWADRSLNLIQWPPFLLASKVHIFLSNCSVSSCKNNQYPA